jgi:hypothetical protein
MNKLLKTKINLDYINQFNPCQPGVDRFIKAGYKNFSGNIVDFIKLKDLSFKDKKWVVFHEDQNLLNDELLREFAFACALRVVERVNIPEMTNAWMISYLMYISGEYDYTSSFGIDSVTYYIDSVTYYSAPFATRSTTYSAVCSVIRSTTYSDAYAAARSVAYFATDAAYNGRIKEEKIQKEILIDLITKYKAKE